LFVFLLKTVIFSTNRIIIVGFWVSYESVWFCIEKVLLKTYIKEEENI